MVQRSFARRSVISRAAPAAEPKSVYFPKVSFEPYWRVILKYSGWSDNKLVAEYVKGSIPSLQYSNAMRIVMVAQKEGQSIVVTAIRDQAEIYCDNLKRKKLDAFLEEA